MKKTISLVLAIAMLFSMNVGATAENIKGLSASNEELDSLEFLSSNVISTERNSGITVLDNNCEMLADCGVEVEIVDNLPDFNDGLIASLNTDTEVYESYASVEKEINLGNVLSHSGIEISSEAVILNGIIVAFEDISISALSLSSENEINGIYSKFGNVSINVEHGSFEGIIYAPEGRVSISGRDFCLNGNIVAKDVDVFSETFEYEYSQITNRMCNILSSIELGLIKTKDELYGEYYSELDCEKLAIQAIMANIEEARQGNEENINLSAPIRIYDADDKISHYGYNFSIVNRSINGGVIVGAHSKTNLVEYVGTNMNFREDCRIYCFSGGEIYYQDENGYSMLNGERISLEEFGKYKIEKSAYYLNLQNDLLETLEKANKNTISVIEDSSLANEGLTAVLSNVHYDGTDDTAYGYGGIKDVKKYLKSRYGGTPESLGRSKYLIMSTSTMSGISGKSVNNCSVVAITRVLNYYRSQKGKTRIDSNISTIYGEVEKIAVKYGYTDSDGLGATKINNVTSDALKHYGYDSTCKGVYVWSFENQVKSEVDAERPVVMNIARGYYGNHSVTVAGYCVYETNGKEYPFIYIVDGWAASYRYIDYNAFAKDLVTSGFGSFNTTIVK